MADDPDVVQRSFFTTYKGVHETLADGPDVVQRVFFTTNKGVHETLVTVRRCPINILVPLCNLSEQCCTRLCSACRDASLEVQRALRNEQGDNFERSKKEASILLFFLCCCMLKSGRPV